MSEAFQVLLERESQPSLENRSVRLDIQMQITEENESLANDLP